MEPEQQIHNNDQGAWWNGKKFEVFENLKSSSIIPLVFQKDVIIIGNQKSKIKRNLKLTDLIGVKNKDQDNKIQIKIVGFPVRKKYLRAQKRYVQILATFYVKRTSQNSKSIDELIQTLKQSIANNTNHTPLKTIIYFNPIAGSNSKAKLNTLIDFFAHTNFSYDLITTTHKGHCSQHLKTIKPSEYRGAAIVSGDGLVHQFINSGVQMPVTHVPAGSGNGFAKNQAVINGQNCGVEQAIYFLIKNRKKGFNLTKYCLQYIQHPIYSFLHFEWGFLSDLDMNSQFLRFLGGVRFDVYGAWRLIVVKRYPGKLFYSQTETKLPAFDEDLSQNQKFQKVQDTFLNMAMFNVPYISDRYHFAPKINIDDEKIDLQYIVESDGRKSFTKYMLSSEAGNHFHKTQKRQADGYSFTYKEIKSWRLEPTGQGQEKGIFGIDGQQYPAQKIQSYLCQKKMISFI